MEQPELRFATGADGARIAYSTLGDGPLLVMTPGRGIPAAHWGRLPALLAERFRVLLYDVRGVGATEVTSDEASMEDIADDLHHLVEAEGGPGPTRSGTPSAAGSPLSTPCATPGTCAGS